MSRSRERISAWRRRCRAAVAVVLRRVRPASARLLPAEGGAPSHQQIERLAYSYWEARGGCGGSALEDWLRAERELKGQAG